MKRSILKCVINMRSMPAGSFFLMHFDSVFEALKDAGPTKKMRVLLIGTARHMKRSCLSECCEHAVWTAIDTIRATPVCNRHSSLPLFVRSLVNSNNAPEGAFFCTQTLHFVCGRSDPPELVILGAEFQPCDQSALLAMALGPFVRIVVAWWNLTLNFRVFSFEGKHWKDKKGNLGKLHFSHFAF